MTASDRPRKGLLRRSAVAIGLALGAIAALAAALALLLQSSAVTGRVVEAILPRASAALGRDVTVKGAGLRLLPRVRVRLRGLAVAGRPGEPVLVDSDGVDVEVGLWPLVRSLGREIDIEAIVLDRPVVNLVRGRDGRWGIEGLGAPGGDRGAPLRAPQERKPAGGPAARVVVRRVAIRGGAIRMIDRSGAREESSVALEQVALDAAGLGAGLAADVHLAASLASEKPNLDLLASVASLPAGVPSRPEDWPAVRGTLALDALALGRVSALLPAGLSAIVQGGVASLDARLETRGGVYRLDGSGDLRELRLRGQPASGRFRASAAFSPAHPQAARAELSELAVKGPGVDLAGSAAVEVAPLRARFAMSGPLLDLDAVMGLVPAGPAPEKPATPRAGPLLTTGARRQAQSATASGTLDVGQLRSGKLTASNVHAQVTLAGGVLEIRALTASLYGGQLDASGSRVDLGAAQPVWNLRAALRRVDLASAMQAVTGRAPLSGKATAGLTLDGAGVDWARLRDQLSGDADVAISDGALSGADLGGQVLAGLGKGLAAAGQARAGERVAGAGGRTDLKDLAASFGVKDGWMEARRPLAFSSPAGKVELGGRIGLDMRLDLRGTVAVPRALLAQAVPRAVKLPEVLPVPVAIGGTLSAPSLQVRADEAVARVAGGQAQEAVRSLRKQVEQQGRRAVGDVLHQLGGGKP